MNTHMTLILIFSIFLCQPIKAENAAAPDFPKEVQKIIERKSCCGHWSGEEPYDAERKIEIEKAMQECQCSKFDKDLQSIEKKYKGNKKILKAIEDASSDG